MPNLQYPRTDIARVLLLEAALRTAQQDEAASRTYVNAGWIMAVTRPSA